MKTTNVRLPLGFLSVVGALFLILGLVSMRQGTLEPDRLGSRAAAVLAQDMVNLCGRLTVAPSANVTIYTVPGDKWLVARSIMMSRYLSTSTLTVELWENSTLKFPYEHIALLNTNVMLQGNDRLGWTFAPGSAVNLHNTTATTQPVTYTIVGVLVDG